MFNFIFFVVYNYFIYLGKSPGSARHNASAILALETSLVLVLTLEIIRHFNKGFQKYMLIFLFNPAIIVFVVAVGVLIYIYYNEVRISSNFEKKKYLASIPHKLSVFCIIAGSIISVAILS